MDTTHGWESTPLANFALEIGLRVRQAVSTERADYSAALSAFTRTTWWPRVWPPIFLTLLVLLALGQFLQVGLVSTDWWPVLSTNQVQNLSDFLRAFREPIGAGDPHFIHETARHY